MNADTSFTLIHPQWDAPIEVDEYDRVSGDDEKTTAQTIAVMTNEVRAAATHPRVVNAVRGAIKEANLDASNSDFESVTDALFWYAKNHVHYEHDDDIAKPFAMTQISLEETMTPPADLLGMPRPAGDCNDFSMLVAAMCRVLGIGTAFKTVAADHTQPQQYSHVFVVARNPANRTELKPLDASNGPQPGVEYRPVWKARFWPIDDMMTPDPQQTLSGLRGLSGSMGDDDDSGGFDWDSFATTVTNDVTKIAAPILQGRYQNPTLAPGTYLTRNANGSTTIYAQPTGNTQNLLPGIGTTGQTNNLLIYAAIGVCVVMLLKR